MTFATALFIVALAESSKQILRIFQRSIHNSGCLEISLILKAPKKKMCSPLQTSFHTI